MEQANEWRFERLTSRWVEPCVDLYIDTFTRPPWNDDIRSRDQVVAFFQNHLKNNYYLGFVALRAGEPVALSVGMKKPWLDILEYYIDEFCVRHDCQGQGLGSWFLKRIEAAISAEGLSGMVLNTGEGYPSQHFYEKNGFERLDRLIVLGKWMEHESD